MALELNGTTGVSLVQDGVVQTADLADDAVTSAKLFSGFANGITAAQQFRLAADQAGSGVAGNVLTNFEENDTDYQAIGSVWSHSSGIFSTTATGIYLCSWSLVAVGTSSDDGFDPTIQISTDSGSNYNIRSYSYTHIKTAANLRGAVSNTFIFDVANASTFRLRFTESSSNDMNTGTTIGGGTGQNETQITFVRLGGS